MHEGKRDLSFRRCPQANREDTLSEHPSNLFGAVSSGTRDETAWGVSYEDEGLELAEI